MTRRRSRARLRVALLGVALLLVNALAFAVFTWPGLTRVRRAENRAKEAALRRADLEKLWAQVLARKELIARNREDIETLKNDYLRPRAEDLFGAQREIEKLARDSGLKPTKSTYSLEDVKGTGLIRCEVDLPLDGSYANLTSFLSRVAEAKRFLVVDQMALSENEQGAKMTLRLSAIFKDGGSRATP